MMRPGVLVVVYYLCLFLVRGVSCLASTTASTASDLLLLSSSLPSGSIQILSTNKNGGHAKTFVLPNVDTTISTPATASYNLPDHQQQQQQQQHRTTSWSHVMAKIRAGLRSTFLPAGYSFDASPRTGYYLSYAVMSWIQDLSTQLRSVLATQKVLEGVGVGRQGATALSALLQFLVRDGCGMAATLVFTSAAASKFKADVKRWRLLADIMVDTGITLEVLAAQVPARWFLPLLCVGNMCKAICGVAAGACSGAIHWHWASQQKSSDIADIQAKFGAQHTVTGSLGLIFAALFARSVANLPLPYLWVLYSILTAIHIAANRECMRLIAFNNLNTVRLNMLLDEFWEQRWKDVNNSTEAVTTLSTPDQVARTEPLLFWPAKRHVHSPFPIQFGVSFNELIQRAGKDSHHVRSILLTTEKAPYWVLAATRRKRRPVVMVALQHGIDPYDQAKAYFHAVLLSRHLARQQKETHKFDIEAAEEAAALDIDEAWGKFAARSMIAGWDLSATEIQTRGYEIQIKQDHV